MKEPRNKRETLILSAISIATLLVAIIGTTFAFFTLTVRGNEDASSVIIRSALLGNVVFVDGKEILWENIILDRSDNPSVYNETKRFYVYAEVEGEEEITFDIPYYIYLLEFSNTLSGADQEYYDGKYFLHKLEVVSDDSSSVSTDKYASDNSEWIFKDGEKLSVPLITDSNMTTFDEEDFPEGAHAYLIGDGLITSRDSRHAYDYTVELINDQENNQNNLQNKGFIGRLYVKLGEPKLK